MKPKGLYFQAFLQLGILQTVLAQDINHKPLPEGGSTSSAFVEIYPQSQAADDSSSKKMSPVPIIAFGVGGFVLGGIIGAQIDQGGYLEITKTEWKSMAIGTAVGITVGYVLANQGQKPKTAVEKWLKLSSSKFISGLFLWYSSRR